MQHPHLFPPASPQAGTVLAIIGGVIARTDKTFPANDRSLCILTAKKDPRQSCAVLAWAYRP